MFLQSSKCHMMLLWCQDSWFYTGFRSSYLNRQDDRTPCCIQSAVLTADWQKTAGTCHGMKSNTSLITRTIKSIVLEEVQLLIHCYVFHLANVASEKYGEKKSGNSTKLVWQFFVYSEFHIRDSNKVTVIKNLPFSTKTWIACVVVF